MPLEKLAVPPGESTPYIIESHGGETMTLPGTKSSIRILASSKETDGKMSVFHMDGVTGDPAGWHFHNKAHDVFLCTQGQMIVSAGEEARVLSPGDFAYVPPKVIHQPQLIGPYNETIGLVTPGDWIDFFRFISADYDGVLAPEFDNADVMASLIPKFREIKEKYDVVFTPGYQGGEVTEWTAKDSILPESSQAYFLKANTGPRYLLGGVLSRPFITTKQSNGQFAVTSIESSSRFDNPVLGGGFSFTNTHQVYYIHDGAIRITVQGKTSEVRAGQSVFVPAGSETIIVFMDKYVRFWAYSSGDGLDALISQGGDLWKGVIVPDKALDIDNAKVKSIAKALNIVISLVLKL